MPQVAIYFEPALGGVRMSTTARVDRVVGRLNRASRQKSPARAIIAAVITDKASARKLRRVLDRAWSGQRRGGGLYTVLPIDAEQVVQHLADRFGMVCYGLQQSLSNAATSLAIARFARGRRARYVPAGDDDRQALDELMAGGLITLHRGNLYRGSERTVELVRKAAIGAVPKRGRLSPAVSIERVTKAVVVPDPHMSRELLLHRMGEATKAGTDPLDVLHRDAYRGAVVNLRDLIGGLASIASDLDEFQQRGASHFRQAAEQGQLGGAKAIDYEVTKVDSSMVNSVTEAGAVARSEYEGAREALKAQRRDEGDDRRPGLVRLSIAERLIVESQSLRQVAVALGIGSGGAARDRIKAIALDCATILARHFGFLRGGRSSTRFDGDKPTAVPIAYRGEITQKMHKSGTSGELS